MKNIREDKIKESFSNEWSYYNEGDKTFNKTQKEIKTRLLREVDCTRECINGKKVLDIGCGNATITRCFSDMGADVTGIDISDSVLRNMKLYPEIKFMQMSVFDMGFRDDFDLVYSKGVLHHTGDTFSAMLKAADAVKSGGILYIWLYSRSTGFKKFLLDYVKPVTKRLPLSLKKVIFIPIAFIRMLKEGGELSEIMVNTFDFFSCPYRDEYDEDEIISWFEKNGFVKIRVTDRVSEGFGILGVKK